VGDKEISVMTDLLDSFYLGPVIFIIATVVGTLFYTLYNKWDVPTSIFFAINTLLGANYGVPDNEDIASKFVSIILYILGTSLIAAAVAAFTTNTVKNAKSMQDEVRKQERFKSFADPSNQSTWLVLIDWQHHSYKYKTCMFAFAWFCLGVIYAYCFEGWDLVHSLHFALGAMSARGDPAPHCETRNDSKIGGCSFGIVRSALCGVYLIVGVQLYMLMIGNYCGLLCERAVAAQEKSILNRPLEQKEFELALSLKHHRKDQDDAAASVSLDLKDFILLELIRLGRLDEDFIAEVRNIFDDIDSDGSGELGTNELREHHKRHFNKQQQSENVNNNNTNTSKKGTLQASIHAQYNDLFIPLISTPNRKIKTGEGKSTSGGADGSNEASTLESRWPSFSFFGVNTPEKKNKKKEE